MTTHYLHRPTVDNRLARCSAFSTTICMCIILLCSCSKERSISFDRLPEKARTFIFLYFDTSYNNVLETNMSKNGKSKTYTVLLNDGTELTFNEKGEWTSLWSQYGTLPESVLAGANIKDIDTTTNSVYKMIRESRYSGINVYLSRDSIIFIRTYDKDGKFIREEMSSMP